VRVYALGTHGCQASFIPASGGVRLALRLLQRRHAATVFNQVFRPPRD
jgi:hypothetical protein